MLGKLIKYEFKATGKLFLMLYAALMVMAILNMAILPSIDAESGGIISNALMALSMIIYVLLIAAIAITTLVVIIQRFYNNLLGDEGYLMFTLPVNTHQHILAKLISAIVWVIASGFMIVLSLFILLLRISNFQVIQEVFNAINSIGFNTALWIFVLAIMIIIGTTASILQFYAAISIGPHITKNRLIGSILAYIGIYIVMQIISLISLLPLTQLGDKFLEIEQTAYGVEASGDFTPLVDVINSAGFMIAIYYMVFYLVISAAFYLVTNYMLNKKLNLA